MSKKILILILILTLIFMTSGCESKEEESVEIPQEGTYSRGVEVEEKIPYNVVDDAVLEYYDENTLFDNSDLIFKGKVLDEKEIGIEEYVNGELNNTYYYDVSTFEIEKIYYSEDPSLEVGSVIKVGNASCSYWWFEGTLKMEKDKKYIVLAIRSSEVSYTDFTKYLDYTVENYWVPIIRVENGKYFVDEELTSLIGNAEEEIIREDGDFKTTVYVKGEEFEEELTSFILEKKGES